MSTKKIREAIDRLVAVAPSGFGDGVLTEAAMAEVEAIEKACVFIDRVDTAAKTPDVIARAAQVSELIHNIAKESK